MCCEFTYSSVSVLRILEETFLRNVPSLSVSGLSLVDPLYRQIVHMPKWIKVVLISRGIKHQLYKL